MTRGTKSTILRALSLGMASLLLVTALPAQSPAAPRTPGKTYFWFPLWPNRIAKYDPVTDELVGTVTLKNGLDFGVDLSHDKKRFLAITGQRTIVEVIDRDTMQVVEEHAFHQDGYIIRVDEVREVPGFTHWFVRVDRVKKDLDTFKIEEPEWWYYDIASKTVEKIGARLPREIANGARISPDGRNWHVFGRDILVLDGQTRRQIGKIDLSSPLYTGIGPIRLRGEDFFEGENPQSYRMMYSMSDPVAKSRSIVGLVDIDIEGLRVSGISEWGADPGVFRMLVSKDKKFGVATQSSGGGFDGGRQRNARTEDPETKILRFDLSTGKKIGESWFRMRPRARLHAISPDGTKFYLGGAGNDFQVYDQDFKLLKTVTFPGDLGGGVWVLDD